MVHGPAPDHRPGAHRRPERGEGGCCDAAGRGPVFLPQPDPAHPGRGGPGGREHLLLASMWAVRLPPGVSCCGTRRCPRPPWRNSKNSNNLRVLESGFDIVVVDTEYRGIGVDTPADLKRVRAILEKPTEEASS